MYQYKMFGITVVTLIIYWFGYQYITKQRIHFWENNATQSEILHKLLDIIYMSDYVVWHEFILRGEHITSRLTYTDLINAYYHLTPINEMKFYKYCNVHGIYSTFIKILGEHSSQ
jgi:hypothetical protein